ncbi:hypothetical protein ACTXT7_004134 [Hymenolepis weldensis]
MKTIVKPMYKCELYNVARAAALTRVGHTAHHLQVNGNLDWILLVGGANLSRCCKNALLLNIKKGQFHSVDLPDSLPDPGLARYEQSSCIYDNEIIIFGGATSEQPLNDILRLTLKPDALIGLQASSQLIAPTENLIMTPICEISPRTQHTSDCITNAGEILIFAGGNKGSEPVDDPLTGKWRTVEVQVEENDIPQCRMGHLMLLRPPRNDQSFLNEEVLYIHGGMSGNKFFDDFYRLQLKRIKAEDGETRLTGKWQNLRSTVSVEGSFWPMARAGHGGAIVYSNTNIPRFFIFGGLNSSGPLNDLHYFDEGSIQWTTVTISGNVTPSPRLDFAFTTLRLKVVNPNFNPQPDELTSTFSVSTLDDDDTAKSAPEDQESHHSFHNLEYPAKISQMQKIRMEEM